MEQKTVLLVGASSGIGYACAKKFSDENFSVLNLSRSPCVLAGVKNYTADFSDNCDEVLREIAERYSVLHCMVYCAGQSMACPIEYVKEKDYRELFDVNFFGFLRCLRVLMPALRHGRASVCAVSSLGAVCPLPFDCYYTASKAALNGLIRALQPELAPKGVTVFAVMPGGTKTDFTFERKIYPPHEVGDYAEAMDYAVYNLAHTEQTGSSAEKVAAYIVKKCLQKPYGAVYTCGFKNKLCRVFAETMPDFAVREGTVSYFLTGKKE